MIITARGEYEFMTPTPLEHAWQELIELIADGLVDTNESEPWTPERLIEKSGVQIYKVVPMTTEKFLEAAPDIKSLLQEMASDRNRNGSR